MSAGNVTIVDYGVGNLFSLISSFDAVGGSAVVSRDPDVIARSDKLILPGVGAFGDAAEKLRTTGLGDAVKEAAGRGGYLLGICLGMQLLFDRSFEFGEHGGLGLLRGDIVPIADEIPNGYKIPHIGWNSLKVTKPTAILPESMTGQYVYFVHSYHARITDGSLSAVTEYGAPLTAAAVNDDGNVFGCQFHPEKSGKVGMSIIDAYNRL